jgi:hypothetical protein
MPAWRKFKAHPQRSKLPAERGSLRIGDVVIAVADTNQRASSLNLVKGNRYTVSARLTDTVGLVGGGFFFDERFYLESRYADR